MKISKKKFIIPKDKEILIRYLIAFIPFIFFNQVYWFLKYLTFNTLTFIFGLFANVSYNFTEGLILINGKGIELIEPCIAVSAFILLFLLNLLTLDIKLKDRFKIFGFSFILLFLFNILRIIGLFFIIDLSNFDLIHKIVWYGLSTIVVVLIWIYITKKFKVKTIPIVSDFAYLIYSLKHDFKKWNEEKRDD